MIFVNVMHNKLHDALASEAASIFVGKPGRKDANAFRAASAEAARVFLFAILDAPEARASVPTERQIRTLGTLVSYAAPRRGLWEEAA